MQVGRIRFGRRVNAKGKTTQRQYRPVSVEKAFVKFSALVPASVRLVLVGVQRGGAGPSGCRLNAWNQHVHRYSMAPLWHLYGFFSLAPSSASL